MTTPVIAPQDQKAADVVDAIGHLAVRNKLGPDSKVYAEMAAYAPEANMKTPVYASIQKNVLDLYGERQSFGNQIADAKSANPSADTLKNFKGFASKITTHCGTNQDIAVAYNQVKAEHAADLVTHMNIGGATDVGSNGKLMTSNYAAQNTGKIEIS